MIHSNLIVSPKVLQTLTKSMTTIVYNELFKLHPYDAHLVGVSIRTQNVINV